MSLGKKYIIDCLRHAISYVIVAESLPNSNASSVLISVSKNFNCIFGISMESIVPYNYKH